MRDQTHRPLRWDQLRQLVRLVGEVGELPGERGVRRHHALLGLSRILGSPAALVLVATPERVMRDVAVTGVDPITRPAFDALASGCAANPAIESMYGLAGKSLGAHVVAPEQALVEGRRWRSSEFVVDHLWRSGLDHMMITARLWNAAGAGECGGFFRCRGDRPFDDRDRNLLELFVVEHADLLWPKEPAPSLPPRLRQTLSHVLAGESAKEIAASLGLSLHTVNEYIAALYRRFEVRSRGELFARLTSKKPLH